MSIKMVFKNTKYLNLNIPFLNKFIKNQSLEKNQKPFARILVMVYICHTRLSPPGQAGRNGQKPGQRLP